MSGDSQRPTAIRYPIAPGGGPGGGVGRWARLGWLAVIAVLVVGATGGYLQNQQEASPSIDLACDEIRTLARDAESTAVATLARRNSLIRELRDFPQFLTPAYLERGSELQSEIPAQESRVLFGYSGWEDALNLDRHCFDSADLIFANTRIKMVQVLFE